jgi:hypothetical protein
MKITLIGKFKKLHDEEYLARTFETLGHEVQRIPENTDLQHAAGQIIEFRPKFVLYCKLNSQGNVRQFLADMKSFKILTVCWVFDLYWGYAREFRLNGPSFEADYVFSTDGGHQKEFEELGINHYLLRQGIYDPECLLYAPERPYGVGFVGSINPIYPKRQELLQRLHESYPGFKWVGRLDTNEMRGLQLNEFYRYVKVLIGDTVYSPNFWSNRVVETLGRGGFLIHQDVEGIKEEYPYLVTYEKDNYADLKAKIEYYLEHEDERRDLIKKNHEWVKSRYLASHKCQELIDMVCKTKE